MRFETSRIDLVGCSDQVLNDYSQLCIRKSKQHLIKFLI